jgi:hypothetical protein
MGSDHRRALVLRWQARPRDARGTDEAGFDGTRSKRSSTLSLIVPADGTSAAIIGTETSVRRRFVRAALGQAAARLY